MTVNEVVEATMNRVDGLSLAEPDQNRDSRRIEACEFELLLQRAKEILETHLDKLHIMAAALIKYETLDADQIHRIMQGKEPGAPGSWSDNGGRPPPSTYKPPAAGGVVPPVAPKPANQS